MPRPGVRDIVRLTGQHRVTSVLLAISFGYMFISIPYAVSQNVDGTGRSGSYMEREFESYSPQPTLMDLLENHVEVGLQVSHTWLNKATQREFDESGTFTGGFLGSIDQLHVKQRYMPTPFLRLHAPLTSLNPSTRAGIQLGYTSLEAETSTYWDGHSDGNMKLSGLTMELFIRHRFESGFAPYAAIGIARLDARFKHEELWHNGFSPRHPEAYESWVSAGRPRWPNGGYRRTIELSDTTAWMISGGCSYYLNPNWVLSAGIRHMAADVDANFHLSWYGENRRDQGNYNIPLDNTALLLSVSYDF